MKHFFRIFIFSCFALFLTAFWNRGFAIPNTVAVFGKAALVLTIIFVLIRPLVKIIFLPLNILTLGLFNFAAYLFFLNSMSTIYHLVTIHAWTLTGFSFLFIKIPTMHISGFWNLVLSSVSLSSIINVLDDLT